MIIKLKLLRSKQVNVIELNTLRNQKMFSLRVNAVKELAVVVFLVFIGGIAKSANLDSTPFSTSSISVPLDEGVSTEVELVWPKFSPKAIVVVVPGTGGLSDPYLSTEITKPIYFPDSRGGLTAKLIGAGYAAAFYNQRGYSTLSKCISGNNFDVRAASFVVRCVNPEIRKFVKLSTIEADTAAVFQALQRHVETRDIPKIVLAYSEGMFHVSSLIQKNKIEPLGVVAVGGPSESMSYIMRYQLGFEFYRNLIAQAFQNYNDDVLDIDHLLSCSNSSSFPEFKSYFDTYIGGKSLAKKDFPVRQEFFKKFVQTTFDHYEKPLPTDEYVKGFFNQFFLSKNWSAGYYTEAFSTKESTLKKIENFSGKVIYIFGAWDHLVPIHPAGACATESHIVLTRCEVRIVEKVGHGLEDENMVPSRDALNQIVSALDAVIEVDATIK